MNDRAAAVMLVCLGAAPAVRAAEMEVKIDLGRQAPGTTETVLVAAGVEVTFRLVNRIPTMNYDVAVRREPIPIPPLPTVVGGVVTARATPCDQISGLARDIEDEKEDEGKIATRVDQVEKALTQGGCTDASVLATVRLTLARTQAVISPSYRVVAGEQLVATVLRGDKKKTWITIVSPGERGKWLVTYGAALVPDRDQRFFTHSIGDSKFVIAQERDPDRGDAKIIPSVFFTWLPTARQARNWSFGPTGGLGVSADRPAVMLGLSLTYNWNLGIVVGASMVQESRLNGRYRLTDPPEVLTSDLTQDQLHKRVYTPRPMIAVTFRFGSNPFGGQGTAAAGGSSAGKKQEK